MSDADLDEAYSFSAYPSVSRDFRVDGQLRGGHWLEGPADGARTYACEVTLGGPLPDLAVRRRGLAALGASLPWPRVRTGDDEVDAAVACYTRAKELPRRLAEHEGAREALLLPGLSLHVMGVGSGQSRLVVDRAVGRDKSNLGMPEQTGPGGYVLPYLVDLSPSRVASNIAGAIAAARALVRACDELAARSVAWSEVALFEAGALDDTSLERLLGAVLEAASWLTGHAARVGNGVEARLALPFGADELDGVLSVTPTDAQALSARLEAALPETLGGILRMTPEQGLRAKLRALFEHEVGDARLDEAFLIEGDKTRLDEVKRAAVSLGELSDLSPHVVIEPGRLVVELHEVPFDARVNDALEAALEVWALLVRHRAGPR